MIEQLLTQQVTITRPGQAVDGYGGTRPDWEHPADQHTAAAWITQLGSGEDLGGGRDTVTTRARMYTRPGVDVAAGDRVTGPDARVWDVDGDPFHAYTPAGPHHIEVGLRAVTG